MANSGVQISALPRVTSLTGNELVPLTQGATGPGTGTTKGATLNQIAGLIGTNGYTQLQWPSSVTVANGTLYFVFKVPLAGQINSCDFYCNLGSFTFSVQIAGVNVGGLTGLNNNSSVPQNVVATSLNTFTAGQNITLVISNATSPASGALVGLNLTL